MAVAKRKKTTKKKVTRGGRPTVMTKEVLNKLEFAFTAGGTVRQACDYAGISMQTLYDYRNKKSEFIEQMEAWRGRTGLRARMNISREIEAGNEDTSRWYLEKTDDSFNPRKRTEVTGENGGSISLTFKWDDE